MNSLLHRWRPAAPVKAHLLAAAALWTIVGSMLGYFGATWLCAGGGTWWAAWAALAAALGGAKAWFVLRKAAARSIARILARGDGKCLGGFASWKTWLLVAAMSGLGRWLRGGVLPHEYVGFIYVAIGVALLAASTSFWRAWRAAR